MAGLDFITEKVIAACPKLKVISRYGVGYDRVDVEAARKHNVIVTNTPGVNSEAVGELAFALILAVARKIPYLNEDTRKGGWMRSTGFECLGKKLCILGLGSIGKVVARCAKGFGMDVCAYDPYINEDYCKEHQIEVVSMEEGLTGEMCIRDRKWADFGRRVCLSASNCRGHTIQDIVCRRFRPGQKLKSS